MTQLLPQSPEILRRNLAADGGSDVVGFISGASGAQSRTVQARLREIISVEDFSGTDRERFIAALTAANGQPVHVPLRATPYEIDAAITGLAVNLRMDDGVVIRSASNNTHQLFRNCNPVILHGRAQIGDTGAYFGSATSAESAVVYWDAGQAISRLEVSGVNFQGGRTTGRGIACADSDVSPVTMTRLQVFGDVIADGFDRSGIELPARAGGTNALWTVVDFSVEDMDTGAGTKRGLVLGSNLNRGQTIRVTRFKADGLSGSGTNEVKGVLCYGEDVLFTECFVRNVRNTGQDDAEALYMKASYGRMTFNTVINGGHSKDGALTIKGSGDESNPQYSNHSELSYNTVIFDDANYDAPALGIQRSYCKAVGNILRDERPGRSGLTYSMAFAVGTATSGVSHILLANNLITGFAGFCGNSGFRALWTDNVVVQGNVITNMDGADFVHIRNDSRISNRTANFNAAARTIELDQGVAFPGNWDPNIWRAGDSIEITTSASNNGTYTIASWDDATTITVAETLTDETGVNVSIYRRNAGVVRFLNNSLSECSLTYFIRATGFAAQYAALESFGNIIDGVLRVYRLDGIDMVDEFRTGQNVYRNVTDIFFGSTNYAEHLKDNKVRGVVSLTAGSAAVNTPYVTSASRIRLTHQNAGGTIGVPYVSARSAGTSFTIQSTSALDTSTIFWELDEDF
ncbi:MAG: hypothetical protein AAF221_08390 [Pseudomonadota bacterium]